MTIGEALKNLRLHAGLTQQQMAAGIISSSFYSKVERNLHAIDADTLIKLLSIHHFDVIEFFSYINNQPSSDPFFNLVNEITFAQNRKDLKKIDKIKQEIFQSSNKIPERIKIRLLIAEAWILHSNNNVSPIMQKKVKSLALKGKWGRSAYHFLSQAIILFNIKDAYRLTNLVFENYQEHPATDTFTLQFIALLAVNYLNCCWHQKADPKYTINAINFLQTALPLDPAIGLERILGVYYQSLFNGDKQKSKNIVSILKDSGYLPVIEDTLNN